MTEILIIVMSLLIWITSKLIFCFLEVLVVDSSIEKDAPNLKRTLKQSIRYYYKFNKTEILTTIMFMVTSSILFIAILLSSMSQLSLETSRFVCDHVLFFIYFDYTLNFALLLVVNYVITYKIKYVVELIPQQVSLDRKLFGL